MSILPKFINLNETSREFYFPLLPLFDYSIAESSSDIVQCLAVYRMIKSVGKNLYQFELQGVKIRDTRLSTLRDKLALAREVVNAARELTSRMTGYREGDTCYPYWQAFHAALEKLDEAMTE